MGTLRGGNGDEQPPNGGGASDGVPELPPEWGRIVIPDDASALSVEADEVRKELRRGTRRYRWQRWVRFAAPGTRDAPSLGVPLAIMAIAVVATLISLFAVAWPGGYPQGTPDPDSVTAKGRPLTLPEVILLDHTNTPIRIREQAPAVVVLVDGCDCTEYVNQLATVADPRIAVLVVRTPEPQTSASPSASVAPGYRDWPSPSSMPASGTDSGGSLGPDFGILPPSVAAGPSEPPTTGSIGPSVRPSGSPQRSTSAGRTGTPGVRRLRFLVDPTGRLRAAVPGHPSFGRQGMIVLISADWEITQVVAVSMVSVANLKPDLERLLG